MCELEAAHILAGFKVKDLKGALVEQVVIVRRDRELAGRGIEQRFTLVGGALCPLEYKDIARADGLRVLVGRLIRSVS
jgi:hypothetical protein